MNILYISPSCPFCHMVMDFAKEHNIALDIRDITDGTNRDDLITKGGKMQVPFFVDEKNNRSLYESQDIIDYLQQQH